MSMSATVLLLTAVSGATPADITPVALAAEARVVHLGDGRYDWTHQLGPSAAGVKLAAETATCDTVMSTTNINNHSDTVPDCRFD